MTYPNSVTTAYSFDNRNRLLQVGASWSGAVITNTQYTYDIGGNRIAKVSPDLAESYDYDQLSRLTGVHRPLTGEDRSYAGIFGNITFTTSWQREYCHKSVTVFCTWR